MTWVDWVLLLYMVTFVGVALVGRPLLQWWRTRINPVRMPEKGGIAGLVGFAFKTVVVALLVATLVYLFMPGKDEVLGTLASLAVPAVKSVGALLLILSATIVLMAQAQMGDSFRIGIDTEHRTALVERGLYKRSRNPIFLGMRIGLLGLFMVMPNAVSLACLLVGDLSIQVQVYLEEEFLANQHGEGYRQFMMAVPRWL